MFLSNVLVDQCEATMPTGGGACKLTYETPCGSERFFIGSFQSSTETKISWYGDSSKKKLRSRSRLTVGLPDVFIFRVVKFVGWHPSILLKTSNISVHVIKSICISIRVCWSPKMSNLIQTLTTGTAQRLLSWCLPSPLQVSCFMMKQGPSLPSIHKLSEQVGWKSILLIK